MRRGSIWKAESVKATIREIIQWPDTRRTTATPSSLGTKLSVNSWIWVTDWNSETINPITRLTARIGAASSPAVAMACPASWRTPWSFTGSS
jgi:hypothetical protein